MVANENYPFRVAHEETVAVVSLTMVAAVVQAHDPGVVRSENNWVWHGSGGGHSELS